MWITSRCAVNLAALPSVLGMQPSAKRVASATSLGAATASRQWKVRDVYRCPPRLPALVEKRDIVLLATKSGGDDPLIGCKNESIRGIS